MNWNAKPESATMPSSYPKSQSSFLQQALINPLASASQNYFNYPGSNQEACMYSSNSVPISQPLLNIKNYTAPQQISVSDMLNGTSMASQTSVERKTYTNAQGPKQLNHNLQMTSGVTQNARLNSQVRNPMLSHTGASVVSNQTGVTVVSNQTGFGANRSNINTLQNQFVPSDTYSLQLQTIPSNSVRVPVTYQGNQGLNPSLPEQQVDWGHHHTANGLAFPDNRSLPKQYCYSQQSFLQDTTLQKRNPMLSALLEVKNSQFTNPALCLQSQQNVPVQSQQYAVTQIDNRPPPPSYDCIYARHPLQNTQQVSKHLPMEVPQNQETHLSEILKDLFSGFQQQWQNPDKEVRTIGNFSSLKVNGNVNQPANKPVRSLVDGVQTFAQNNQDKRMDSGTSTSNPVLDTNVTKEGLVRDFKKLVNTRKKLLELARKIKINQNLLMAAGCSKATNTSHGESAQNSELSLKQTSRIQSGLQVTPVTPGISGCQPSTVMKSAEETNRTRCTLNSSIQEMNCKKFNQDNSILLNSGCSEKLPMPDQSHNLQALTSLKTSAVEITQTTLNNTQFSSENVRGDQNLPTNPETVPAPQSVLFQEYVSKYPNKNTLLRFLMPEDKTENKSIQNGNETIQDPKPKSFEINQNTHITGNLPNLKTMETQCTSNENTKVSDKSFFLDLKSSTNGISSKSDSHCSMELLATCLSLWKKQPSEPAEEKQDNESRTNRITICISKPAEVCEKSPCTVVGGSHNKTLNNVEQETTLPMGVQNYESSGASITKGSELQIAVVSPLILSNIKTISFKGLTREALLKTMYPVIKEGSVCSLQDQLTENTSITPLKPNVNELVASTTSSTKVSPLIQKAKQDKSTNCNSEGVPNTNQGKHIESKLDVHTLANVDISIYPDVSGSHQVLDESRGSTVVSGDTLQIVNICSLVEGDVSYNSQIAKIFNSPSLDKVEPQKPCLPDHQVISCRQQKEQLDKTTENENFNFQKEKIVQVTDVSPMITDQPESLLPSEPSLKYVKANGEAIEENKLECITNKEIMTSDVYSSAVIQQGSPEIDTPCNYIAQDPTSNEILNDDTSVLYLHDQLSELLKEFPYGIEAVNSREGSVGQQITEQVTKDQSCDKTVSDSQDSTSTDQIKITIMSSEQMKELFPEQVDQLSDDDKFREPQKEKPIMKVESQYDPKAHPEGESHDSVVSNLQKDDIHCCALGWLSMIYDGVPQCQCNSIKNLATKEEKTKDQCSPLETNKCRQEERTSDRDIPDAECNSAPSKDLKAPLTLPDGKNCFPEIKQENVRDNTKTKHNNSLKTGKELPSQFSSVCDKKLDPLQSHKRKRKLQFHEVTFHSSNKLMKFCEQDTRESLQKKHIAQNSRPLKAKTVILTNKNRDLYKKNGSLIQTISPEKIKLKFRAGGSRYKLLENRKIDQGNIFDIERKKKKHDKREQSKNAGSSFKLCNSLSNSNERTSIKEKTVSIEVKSTNLEINIHRSLMKSSNSNIKSSDSKDMSCKILTPKEYLQRQKHKEAMGNKVSKKNCVIEKIKNVPCTSEYITLTRHSTGIESCRKSNEKHGSIAQTSKESLNFLTSHGKTVKIHHSEESKIHTSSKNMKGTVGGKQPDKIWMDKTKTDKHLADINNEGEFSQMTQQAMDQRKQYLNRVAFKCTERESICLSKLDNSLRKPKNGTERSQENKPKSFIPVKDATEKPTMLEFKLCPDALLENRNFGEEGKKLKPPPRKEQAPVQVSGIKSTKEAWLKCVNTEKRMREASQKIDKNVLPKSKLPKRSVSADGLETLQNTVKDSKAMFQTYKKMYMEKRSRSLGNSP
ncbi:retroelement silencing factor 1 isoform X1 [Loxodonta africana]|uniref:retroelement silencing factor 1 isoform X1 n=1 Tax=Loxodonta africana TaxID=9785 RepID=UPI0030D3093E